MIIFSKLIFIIDCEFVSIVINHIYNAGLIIYKRWCDIIQENGRTNTQAQPPAISTPLWAISVPL